MCLPLVIAHGNLGKMEHAQQRYRRNLDQKAINMVDLMMWIVIASLLLAVALQGLSYYRQAASIYELQNDVMGAAQNVTAKASEQGSYTAQLVSDGANDSKKSNGVTVVADPGANDADGFVLRATKAEFPDKEVIFISKQRGSYVPGIHIVPKGTVVAADGSTTVVTPPSGGGGSVSGVTFTPITSGPSSTANGIRYVNAVLAYEASLANRTDDWDFKRASSEWIERDDAYAELSYPEAILYDTDVYYRKDSNLPALNATYQSKLDAFNADESITNQQAMVDALREIFATAIANPIADTALYPSPSHPEMFADRTVPAGSDAATVVRVALPTSLTDPDQDAAGGPMGSLVLAGTTRGVDNDYTYWDVELKSGTNVQDANGTIIQWGVWQPGTYTAWISVMDNRGVGHSMSVKITVV